MTPEALAASGFSGSDATAVLTRISNAETLRDQIQTARATRDQASQGVTTAKTALERNPGSGTHLEAFREAQDAMSAARTAVLVAETTLRTAALDGCTSSQMESLAAFMEASQFSVPDELRVVHRTQEEWRRLEKAIAEEKFAILRSIPVRSETQALLSEVRSTSSVIAALSSLSESTTAIAQQFTAY
ncbi:MAG: hypothetical protein AB7Q00_07990 [Phycisphaerales bacterium]